jgi:hypothetical protein
VRVVVAMLRTCAEKTMARRGSKLREAMQAGSGGARQPCGAGDAVTLAGGGLTVAAASGGVIAAAVAEQRKKKRRTTASMGFIGRRK